MSKQKFIKLGRDIAGKFLIIAIVLGAIFLVDHFILAWTSPTAPPPGNNVTAPLNVGSAAQSKSGYLGLGGSFVPTQVLHLLGKLRMEDGTQGEGKVMVSSADGTARWEDAAAIGGGSDGDWTLDGNNMYSAVSGNVGIGTASPVEKLHTSGNIRTDGGSLYLGEQRIYGDGSSAIYYDSNNNTVTQMIFRDKQGTRYGRVYGSDNGARFGLIDGDGGWSYLAYKDNYTQLRINNSTKMHINSAGNIGIGTTDPSSGLKLDVEGRIGATEYCDENGQNCSSMAGGGGGGYWTDAGTYIYANNSGNRVGAAEYCDLNGQNCFKPQEVSFILGSNELRNTVNLPNVVGSGGGSCNAQGSVTVSCPVIGGRQTVAINCAAAVSGPSVYATGPRGNGSCSFSLAETWFTGTRTAGCIFDGSRRWTITQGATSCRLSNVMVSPVYKATIVSGCSGTSAATVVVRCAF